MRDYVSLLHDTDEDDAVVNVLPAIDHVGGTLADLVALQAEIMTATERMQAERLRIMQHMKAAGFSYADIAGAVGISKVRVSQLISRCAWARSISSAHASGIRIAHTSGYRDAGERPLTV